MDDEFPTDESLWSYWCKDGVSYSVEQSTSDIVDGSLTRDMEDDDALELLDTGGLLSASSAPIVPGMSLEASISFLQNAEGTKVPKRRKIEDPKPGPGIPVERPTLKTQAIELAEEMLTRGAQAHKFVVTLENSEMSGEMVAPAAVPPSPCDPRHSSFASPVPPTALNRSARK